MPNNDRNQNDAAPAASDELSSESLEAVSGGVVGDCTGGGGWPTKPTKPTTDYPPSDPPVLYPFDFVK